MEESESDCVLLFLERVARGEILLALQEMLPSPDATYESLQSSDPKLLEVLCNHSDASRFGIAMDALLQKYLLIHELKLRPTLPFSEVLLQVLGYEVNLLNFITMGIDDFKKNISKLHPFLARFVESERNQTNLSLDEANNLIANTPVLFRNALRKQLTLSRNLKRLKELKPFLIPLLKKINHPWYAVNYSANYPLFTLPDEFPLFFLAPCNGNLSQLKELLVGRPAFFVFETCASFLQILQDDFAFDILSDKEHGIFIMELYPNEQLKCQPAIFSSKPIHPIIFPPHRFIEEALQPFLDAFTLCLQQTESELLHDTEAANWLYAISQQLRFRIDEWRFGKNRIVALIERAEHVSWHDPHKQKPSSDKFLGPQPDNIFQKKIESYAAHRKARSFIKQNKIRLAHVTAGLVESGHAPTRLLALLLEHRNRELFDVMVVATERHVFRKSEYPPTGYLSPRSYERAPNLIQKWQSDGIRVCVAKPQKYEKDAAEVSRLLNVHNIDVAVFHGPDSINTICAQITDVPLRVLFEHGTTPTYPGYDIVICSSEQTKEIHQKEFESLGTKPYVLPYAYDVRSRWKATSPSKKELGYPEDSFLMTTISNHLDARLGTEMCKAIAEILQRCPKTYYTPIGRINAEKLLAVFAEYGVAQRVILHGNKENPANETRVMQLYLNEFPFGSGLGVLEAMACGCPVVTMCDIHGPPQARYGAVYFGEEHAVTSGKREDYVALACRLIQDPEMYRQWSEHAIRQYEKHADVKAYVAGFEQIILQALSF